MADTRNTILRVSEGGRIVIPLEVRKRLGIEAGSRLLLTLEGDHATLASVKAARCDARRRVSRYIKPHVSLSRELMAERKAESRRE